ncbi:LURP-one-related/scramblase family protein [Clostridium sardiniense]|uniref:LURP-one-related/scramblase family protein n=1 Tax=Clostridium sardiniense TaxID=29369 RepID=UPI003D3409AC
MKYILNQNLVSIGNDYLIKDANGDVCYKVDGKVFTIGERLFFEDSNGNKLFKIRKKHIKLAETFEVYRANEPYAKITKRILTPIEDEFIIDTPYGELIAKGDFTDYEFCIYDEYDTPVAKASKSSINSMGKYAIDIENFNDHGLILACAVIIDLIEDDE